ncbi:hypothetical protein NUW54_g14106 [Trametes sanguinea]|uniref:Uncharacterized protein n=1 Tax=Trametes sanguinea TaxID=158606 RepID=A0ACC1MEU0_9APHY|nr:hypothetical protein NUW54_g14106 [Trametes sanguinea]
MARASSQLQRRITQHHTGTSPHADKENLPPLTLPSTPDHGSRPRNGDANPARFLREASQKLALEREKNEARTRTLHNTRRREHRLRAAKESLEDELASLREDHEAVAASARQSEEKLTASEAEVARLSEALKEEERRRIQSTRDSSRAVKDAGELNNTH